MKGDKCVLSEKEGGGSKHMLPQNNFSEIYEETLKDVCDIETIGVNIVISMFSQDQYQNILHLKLKMKWMGYILSHVIVEHT